MESAPPPDWGEPAGFVLPADRLNFWQFLYRWRPALVGFFIIFVAGFYLRYLCVDRALPYEYYWDEPEIMQPALRVLRNGVYRPARFAYGPLNAYIHAGWAAVNYARGLEQKQFPDGIWGLTTDRETGWYWSIGSPYLWRGGRVLCVFFGLIAIVAIFRAGVVLGGTSVGLWAAAVIAFSKVAVSQTKLVTADASTMAAAAVCMWASAHILRSRPRWAYWIASLMAALAIAFKYTSFPVALFPILAHLLSSNPGKGQRAMDARLPLILIIIALGFSLFAMPVFFQPTRFLHDLTTESLYYGSSGDAGNGMFTVAQRLVQQTLATLQVGDFQQRARGASRAMVRVFNLQPSGAILLMASLVGAAWLAMRRFGVFIFLGIPALINLLFVAMHNTEFFARNNLLALHCTAIISGFAWAVLLERARPLVRSFVPRDYASSAVAGAFVLLFLPMTLSEARRTMEDHNYVDPRTTLSKKMLESLPPGSGVMILDETRWITSPEEEKRFKISRSTVYRAMIHPPSTTETQYIVAPGKLQFYIVTPARLKQEEEMNSWLTRGTTRLEAGREKSETMYFGRPSVNPWVRVIQNDANFKRDPVIPENSLFGSAFESRIPGTAHLGQYALAFPPDLYVQAPVSVTIPARRAIFRGRNLSPDEEEIPPVVYMDIATSTDLEFKHAIIQNEFTLNRSQSGAQDYRVNLATNAGAALKPDIYNVRLRAKDLGNFLTEIESFRFE